MDITPSPRILRMLGEIEFDEWQCIAELVDNAFDDFTDIIEGGHAWPGLQGERDPPRAGREPRWSRSGRQGYWPGHDPDHA